MAEKSTDGKKMDMTSLPRGAIGIKGLPISRNTRLPSIRSPRDLTLGAPPKRTFMPNIPVRREKKPAVLENNSVQVKQEVTPKVKEKLENERGRDRGKRVIIQTGGIFSEGISGPCKEKVRDSYQKSDFVSGKTTRIKKEKEDEAISSTSRLDELFRDDFIDDGDDDDVMLLPKPTIFPIVQNSVKQEIKSEEVDFVANASEEFNQDIAKEVGFDVNRVRQFIKKEKGVETEEKATVDTTIQKDDISSLFTEDLEEPRLLLLQFPSCVTLMDNMDYSQPENSEQTPTETASKSSKDQKSLSKSIGSLPEGSIGKLQVLKSGKIKLVMGSLSCNLGAVNQLKSKHEVVSIKTDNTPGDLSVLGYTEHKLIFDPDTENFLEQYPEKNCL